MPLSLEYTLKTTVPVEVEGLIPSAVAGKTASEVARLEIHHGKEKLPLGEAFRLSGSAADGCLVFSGDLSGVHWIGAHADSGEIRVEGHAGRHAGSQMRGGQITVTGDAGDCLGAEMRGGLIRVAGRAGHLVGAAYRGSPKGMRGGTILVGGAVGNETGHSMRRGLIAVGGAGDAPGAGLLAGTILCFGPCGIRPGIEMRRGTLGLFGPEPPPLPLTFRYGCRVRPVFLAMILRHLDRLGYRPEATPLAETFDLYHGDMLNLGRGEVLIPTRSVSEDRKSFPR